MILIGQYDSPFVRRVAITMRLYGIAFEHRPWPSPARSGS
jgi:glutathione S-transferase